VVGYPCLLAGTASQQTITTSTSTSTSTSTTSTTSTSTTIVPFECALVPGSFTTELNCVLVAGEFIYVPS
jgi:hypothetical protein